MIRAAVGRSSHPDPARAALEAVGRVRETLGDDRPDFCILFVTPEHVPGLSVLLGAVSQALGTPYVTGCTGSGILTGGWESEDGPALGVLAIRSDTLRATPFLFHDEGDMGMTAGVRLGQRLQGSRGSDDLLLVWPDPFHVRPDRLLHSLDAVLGDVPVLGGASSGDGGNTVQFCGDQYREGSVSGVRFGGEFRSVVGITQGCRPLGEPLRVTRAHENLILEVDGRPALEVLRERAPEGLLDQLEWALNFVFVGLLPDSDSGELRQGEYLIRNIVEADPDTGVLAVAAHVEEGQHVVFAHRDARGAEEDLRKMLQRVSPENTGLDYRFGLYFNCLARGRSLYQREGIDAALLREALPDVPTLGFFCNAEIGPLNGVNQLFTYTGVLLLVAD
jgi:small ligand-binding sensory domain FIST